MAVLTHSNAADDDIRKYNSLVNWQKYQLHMDYNMLSCIIQVRAETAQSALPFVTYSHISYIVFLRLHKLKRSLHICCFASFLTFETFFFFVK